MRAAKALAWLSLMAFCAAPAAAVDQDQMQKTITAVKELLAADKDEQAFDLYREKIHLEPREPAWRSQLAKTMSLTAAMYYKDRPAEQVKYFDEAERLYTEAAKLYHPKRDKEMIAQCYYAIGEIYEFPRRQPGIAAPFYKKALELDPAHGPALKAIRRSGKVK